MKNHSIFLSLFFLLLIGCGKTPSLPSHGTSGSAAMSDSVFLANAGSMAMNYPDQFNWEVFARICRSAASQNQAPGGKMTNNVIWETWADDLLTFPDSPDVKIPPVFPGEKGSAKNLVAITQQAVLVHALEKAKKNQVMIIPNVAKMRAEEVRRNFASFNYIVTNDLWYQEGIALNFSQRTANGSYDPVAFPVDAIEVKAVWDSIREEHKLNYHWNYDNTGQLYGLLALHLMTKAIPNWTWATFEWVGNKGRCADMGCHDAFGVKPANVDPHPGPNNQRSPRSTDKAYAAGELTDGVKALFKKYGLSDEWMNYRLKGSQIDWVDATGRPTLVGNSVTEDGFVNTSSCISCHAIAGFYPNGKAKDWFFDSPAPPPNSNLNLLVGPTGAISPDTFWHNGQAIYLAADFVWGLRKAQPVKN